MKIRPKEMIEKNTTINYLIGKQECEYTFTWYSYHWKRKLNKATGKKKQLRYLENFHHSFVEFAGARCYFIQNLLVFLTPPAQPTEIGECSADEFIARNCCVGSQDNCLVLDLTFLQVGTGTSLFCWLS